jgi:hypothetical protein
MKRTVTRGQVLSLHLVYPAISNQEAVWLEQDPDVQEELRANDFYMIAARPEAKFHGYRDRRRGTHRPVQRAWGIACASLRRRIREIPGLKEQDGYWLEAGEKLFRAWDGPIRAEGSNVLDWFTTEKLLWDKTRGVPGIEGLERVRDLMTYDLLLRRHRQKERHVRSPL